MMFLQGIDVGPQVHRGITDGMPTTLSGYQAIVKEGPSSLAATIPQFNLLIDIEGIDDASARAILDTMRPQ
jgi:hypothetical protein